MWEFFIYNSDETEKWEIPYTRMVVAEELNKGLDGNLSMSYKGFDRYAKTLKTTPDNILAGGFRSWKLFRNNQVFRSGVLSHRAIEAGATGASTIVLYFTDYIGLLGSRSTQEYDFYNLDDSSDIAWSIIAKAQTESNGDMGIERGTNPETVDRQRTLRYDNIRDVIVGMSNAKQSNGYDFDIDTMLNFNVYYPTKGLEKPEIVFSQFNIDSYSLNMPLTSKLANRVNIIGEGFGEEMVTATVEDTTPQTTWGLLEKTLSEKSVSRVAELENRASRELERSKEPTNVCNLTTKDFNPEITTYDLGDSVNVRLEEINFDEMLRIESRNIDIKPSGQAIIDITFFEGE